MAEEQRNLAEESLLQTEGALREAEQQRTLAQQREQQALIAEQQQRAAREETLREKERAGQRQYVSQIRLAQRAWQGHDLAVAREHLNACPPNMRGWEYDYLDKLFNRNQQTLRGHTGWIHSVAFSPDGTRIVSSCMDGTLKVWDGSQASDQKGR